jgi:predicted O-linked N-acetylglucosamine transferase (SPINDLY family)
MSHELRLSVVMARNKNAEKYFQRGEQARLSGNIAAAIDSYRRAIALDGNSADVHNNLAVLLRSQGDLSGAIRHFKAAAATVPRPVGGLHYNLASALEAAGRLDEAIAEYRRAIQVAPQLASAYVDLALILRETGELDAAEDHLRKAVTVAPNLALGYANLATVLKDQGDPLAAYRAAHAAVQADPTLYLGWSNLLFNLPYLSDQLPVSEIEAAYRSFSDGIELAPRPPCDTPSSGRKLRIGYVSADFRDHSVNYFLEPVIQHHDRSQFELYFYDIGTQRDEVSLRLREYGGAQWRAFGAIDDDELATRIAEDAIDVLIDLMGHTAGNRLPVFAHRPARVQLNWLGWPSTTGLRAIDCVVSDPYVEATDGSSLRGPEDLLPLPSTWLCYRPDSRAPQPAPVPSRDGEPVTFGSFTGIYKISEHVMRTWAEILRRLPNSRLLISGVPPGRACARLIQGFGQHGIDEQRLMLRPPASLVEFFAMHAEVDIALDTFPFNGCTTTLHSLWLGVPVISLIGSTHAGRMGLSIMSNLNRKALLAHDVDEYVSLAIDLGSNPQQLSELRESLRHDLLNSPLMDEAGFTADLENSLRSAFDRYSMPAAGGA